ncbi:MAG TPA: DUF4097 family beta strand repeat-containing protein [Bacteroidales bacterium]|nr:DUF4097 family beta strand repeat-containing protein [Bacteroidales bacterium]
MKTYITLLLTLLSASVILAQNPQTETLTVPLSKPGQEYSLKVKNFLGQIKITGYEGKDIQISVTPEEADNNDDGRRPAEAQGMKKISTDRGYELTAKEADNNVTVNTNNFEKVVNLELKIPQNVRLEAGTVNEGVVTIENISGDIEVNNINDDIKLTGISGSVVANTVNGDVRVSFKSIKPETPMAFSTLNGDVNVEFPADLKARVKIKSDHGDVYSDFDIEIDKTPAKTEKVSQPGLYQIKKDDWIYGKINGGGPEMMFKNMTGDIYIKKVAK